MVNCARGLGFKASAEPLCPNVISKYRMGTTGLKSKETKIFPIAVMVRLIAKRFPSNNIKNRNVKKRKEKRRKESESEDT